MAQSIYLGRFQFAPFVLTPSPFPRTEFYKAVEMQPILNELTHRVAHDERFLKESLAETLAVDSFTARLFDIWEKVRREGVAQVSTRRFKFYRPHSIYTIKSYRPLYDIGWLYHPMNETNSSRYRWECYALI
jgi:hypothetical protein